MLNVLVPILHITYPILFRNYYNNIIHYYFLVILFVYKLNSLLFSALFALQHKLQFVLYSKDCHFAFGNGWNEFFGS